MLHTISWQQYLTVVFLLTAAWYAFVALKYYRTEVATFLKFTPKPSGFTPPVANQMTAVIGEAVTAPGEETFDPQDVLYAGSGIPDEISDQTLPKGPADDLLAEAQTLVTVFQETDNKSEFLSLLKVLIDKYEVFADEISLPATINTLKQFAQNRLPFRLSDTEWPLNF
ncbi:MAG TPA: hypothetical protein VGN20_14225 [Mucilaginibacter sp.]|jgi:hypothetical protein